MRARSAALLLALAGPALGAPAAPRQGHVVQVTRARAYLDAGALDGLMAGASIELRRGGAPAGRCKLEQVSDHRASCTGGGARAGDVFALPGADEEKPVEVLRAPELPAGVRAAQAAALSAEEQPLVPFHATALAPGLPGTAGRADVQLAHASWLNAGAGPWHEERLDVAARGVPLGAGLSLWLDLSARHFLRQGSTLTDTSGQPYSPRFRPDTPDQLYVWEAQISAREGPGFNGSLGRVNPWSAPGAPRVDGAQAGFRTESGQEFGVYGGGLPDQVSLAPTFNHATAGAFWSLQRRASEESALPVLLQQGRLALVTTPEGGQRLEAEATAQAALLQLFDLAGELRIGAGGKDAASGTSLSSGLEAARFSLGARLGQRLSLDGSFRYIGLGLPQYAGIGAATGGPARSADLGATWEPIDGLRLAATSGGVRDLTSGLDRWWLGPEVSLPRLFGRSGGLTLGYQEERGWLAGRNLWLQSQLQPAAWLRLLGRLSFSQDHRPEGGFDDQLGLFVSLAVRASEHVEFRLGLLGRIDPRLWQEGSTPSQGMSVDAAIAGIF